MDEKKRQKISNRVQKEMLKSWSIVIHDLGSLNVSSHYNKDGKMYMPSYPYGVNLGVLGVVPDNGMPLSSRAAKTQSEAREIAKKHHESNSSNHAVVFRRRDGKILARYYYNEQKSPVVVFDTTV